MPESIISPSIGVSPASLKEATATPDKVASGSTFFAGDSEMKTGTMPLYEYGRSSSIDVDDNDLILKKIPSGFYNEGSDSGQYPQARASKEDVANAIGLTPDVLKSGTTILGVDGTLASSYKVVFAGRIWAPGYANGSGFDTSSFGSYNMYATGQKGTYDARIYAKVSAYYCVYIQRNNANPECTSKWFNSGEQLAWVGPSTYGDAQAFILVKA